MPALPKRRHSTHRQGKRRANIKLKKSNLSLCPSCGKQKLSHYQCSCHLEKSHRPKTS